MRHSLDLSRAIAVVGALVLPGIALAQEPETGPPFRPSNDQLNQELDDTLRNEYDPDHPPPPEPGPPAPPPPAAPREDHFKLRLGGVAAHYYSCLHDVTVGYREGSLGGDLVDVDDDDAVADLEPEHGQHYRAWIDIGKHVSLEGGFRRGLYRAEQEIQDGFSFGRVTFTDGERVDTKFDVLTADLDLVIKPINNRWVEIGLHAGTRYMFWRTEFKSVTDPARRSMSTLEACVPVVGVSLAIRPVRVMELFARARIGMLEYEREAGTRRHHGHTDTIEAKLKEAKSVELDLGVSFTIKETIGLMVGYRVDYLRIEREVDARAEFVEGTAHGVYAGLLLQF